MRKYLRRICRAQGIQWPGLGHKIKGGYGRQARLSARGPRRRAALEPTLYKRVQEAVIPERWIPNLRGVYELLGVWRAL